MTSRIRSRRIGAIASLAALSACSGAANEFRFKGFSASQYFLDSSVEALARAGCAGNVGAIDELIARGVSPNAKGVNMMSPLMWAIHCQNEAGVSALLSAGGNPNQRDFQQFTPFLVSLDYDDQRIIGDMIKHGADLYYAPEGKFPLGMAFHRGLQTDNWRTYYTLISNDIDVNHVYNVDDTVAFYAVQAGKFRMAIDLINHGYNHSLDKIPIILRIREPESGRSDIKSKRDLIELLRARGVPYDKIIADYDTAVYDSH